MAASQATLLMLTARMHDVEYKAQNIENQKIALATQKDEVYQEYMDALDAKKIQVAFRNSDATRNYIDATFETMCTYQPDRCTQYSLKDAKTGKVIVDENTAKMYKDFNTDKYAFAYAMLGMDADFGWPVNNDDGRYTMGMEVGIGVGNYDYGDGQAANGSYNLFMTDVERKVFENHKNADPLKKPWNLLQETCNSASASDFEKQEALDSFRDALYENYGSEIYKYMRLNKNEATNTNPDAANAEFNDEYPEDFSKVKGEFDFYVKLFEEIQVSGGCQLIDPQYESGSEGNQWLNNMVSSGRVLIDVYDERKGWTETSIATSTNVNNLQEVEDTTNQKKAEAKYEHELGIINQKDSKFDRDLSKLETERTAMKTEMDAVKQVRNDNEERTFGIFG